MFAIEVEFLTGVSVAAAPQGRDSAEWPPHPDRLFQALVAAWGRDDPPSSEERQALEWLEQLDAGDLMVVASRAGSRDVLAVYVPTNDVQGTSPRALPAQRTRKERYFPAAVPERSVMRYVWRHADGFEEHRPALIRLAREVTYLGHSHTLVRVAVREVSEQDAGHSGDLEWLGPWPRADLRIPYPGRLEELALTYREGSRSRPSLAIRRFERETAATPRTLFDAGSATVLVDAGGFVPALEAFPLVAKRLRDALLALVPPGTPIPTLLSGHEREGEKARSTHVAIVPLADVGWTHSRGRLMGLALVWPRDGQHDDRMIALRAVAGFVGAGGDLRLGRPGVWRLELDPSSDRASLRIRRYVGPARRWATVLPAVIDRHPKARPEDAMEAIVWDACRNVGLPSEALDGLDVRFSSYPLVAAAPSVSEVAHLLAIDSPYRNRPLRHLVLTFAKPVAGPLSVGAGRFRGLGWCLPLEGGAS